MRYEMMISPFEMVDFDKMNKKQAQDYFDWYIEQSDYRISLLLNSIKEDGIDYSFDYSVESLIPLWEWFENKIEFRQLSVAEYESVVSKYPEWLRDSIDKTHLSWETLMYCADIGLYFAEVIIRHNEKVSWGFFTKPKNRMNVNQPVLLGFNYDKDLNPRVVVVNCALRSGEKRLPTRLYDIYMVWEKYL